MMKIWVLMLLSFVLTFLGLMWLINYQMKRKIGQTERLEGLNTHKKKNNTPIFGGVSFLISYFIVFTFLLINKDINLYIYFLIVFPMMCYGTIGFIDDILILKRRKNEGLKPNVKFLLQIMIAMVYFIVYLLFNFDTTIDLLFFSVDLKFLYGIFILFAFSGFTNALNLTDGIDGLLAGTLSFTLIGIYIINTTLIMNQTISIIFAGLCAFLYFNLPKAKIFMGDTGSLALGALFTTILIILKLEFYLFIFGLVYILEALSVILQVTYFKATKGKRIFKMAPLHHHFEIVLGSEIKTLILFYFITIATVFLGVLMYLNLN